MINYIQGQLNIINNADGTNFSVQWDNIDYKVTFANVSPFTLRFNNTGSNTPLGYYLGFRGKDGSYDMANQYTYDDNGTTLYYWTGETFLDTTKEEYIFVRINDYGNLYNDVRNTNILAKIVLFESQFVFDNGSNFLTKEYKFKQLKNINKLEIELLLPTGETVNMNYIDFSLTLEMGQLESATSTTNTSGSGIGPNNTTNNQTSNNSNNNLNNPNNFNDLFVNLNNTNNYGQLFNNNNQNNNNDGCKQTININEFIKNNYNK
jgi:hypothetical protein